MLTPQSLANLLFGAALFGGGVLAGWGWFRWRATTAFVTADLHQQEIQSLRRRYRRRLRAMRDLLLQRKLAESDARLKLRALEGQQCTMGRKLDATLADNGELRARLQAQDTLLAEHARDLAAAGERSRSLEAELRNAQERMAAYERDQGLLRIERDELVARTQRLRALQPNAATDDRLAPANPQRASSASSRTELADRNARIHALECQLRESEGRVNELESSLQTWKYRIAPLALHMKMQRDKARRRKQGEASAAGDAAAQADDLQRIRGINAGLQRKLEAAGITQFAQLAGMSPAEMANLAVRIGVAPSRPQRDGWAEQAQKLCV